MHLLLLLSRWVGAWLLLTDACVFDIVVLVLEKYLLHLVLPIVITEQRDRVRNSVVFHLV